MSEDHLTDQVITEAFEKVEKRLKELEKLLEWKEGLEKKFSTVEEYYEKALTEHEKHITEDLLDPQIKLLKEKLEANLKARLPEADWVIVNKNFLEMSSEITELRESINGLKSWSREFEQTHNFQLNEQRKWVRDLIYWLKWKGNLQHDPMDMGLEQLLHRFDHGKKDIKKILNDPKEVAKADIVRKVNLYSPPEPKDCNKCPFYGECDHQGAYQKDGKWCYEASGGEKSDLEKTKELLKGAYPFSETQKPPEPKGCGYCKFNHDTYDGICKNCDSNNSLFEPRENELTLEELNDMVPYLRKHAYFVAKDIVKPREKPPESIEDRIINEFNKNNETDYVLKKRNETGEKDLKAQFLKYYDDGYSAGRYFQEQKDIEDFVNKFNEMWHKIATVMSNWSVGSEYSFKAEQHVEINDILDIFKRYWEGKRK